MKVVVLYFAVLRDLVGLDREELSLEGPVSVQVLGGLLEARHPELAGRLAVVRFAIDETFVRADASVHDGAVVALIPPVAGG